MHVAVVRPSQVQLPLVGLESCNAWSGCRLIHCCRNCLWWGLEECRPWRGCRLIHCCRRFCHTGKRSGCVGRNPQRLRNGLRTLSGSNADILLHQLCRRILCCRRFWHTGERSGCTVRINHRLRRGFKRSRRGVRTQRRRLGLRRGFRRTNRRRLLFAGGGRNPGHRHGFKRKRGARNRAGGIGLYCICRRRLRRRHYSRQFGVV